MSQPDSGSPVAGVIGGGAGGRGGASDTGPAAASGTSGLGTAGHGTGVGEAPPLGVGTRRGEEGRQHSPEGWLIDDDDPWRGEEEAPPEVIQ